MGCEWATIPRPKLFQQLLDPTFQLRIFANDESTNLDRPGINPECKTWSQIQVAFLYLFLAYVAVYVATPAPSRLFPKQALGYQIHSGQAVTMPLGFPPRHFRVWGQRDFSIMNHSPCIAAQWWTFRTIPTESFGATSKTHVLARTWFDARSQAMSELGCGPDELVCEENPTGGPSVK